MVLDAERHGVRKKFFESVGRHCLEALGVDAIHELLESEDGGVDAGTF